MIKCLEENIIVNLHDLGLGNDFLVMRPKAKATKEKIKWTSSKLILLYTKGHYQESDESTHRMGENISNL